MERGKMASMGSDSPAASFRVAVIQASSVFFDIPATIDKAERLLDQAASSGAQLVVFPEAFIGGYLCASTHGVSVNFQKYNASAIKVPGPEIDRLSAVAGKHKVYLVMGVIERDGHTLYSTVLFFDSLGHYLGKHRKLMLTASERTIWGYGDGSTIPVFDTPIGKIGAAIARENRMPLLRTAMYAKGIEIYCAPTASAVYSVQTDDGVRDIVKESMANVALEGGCFVLLANQFCRRRDYPSPPEYCFSGIEEALNPDTIICGGGSMIISPTGVVLAGPSYEGEVILSAILDGQEIAQAKKDFDVVGDHARHDIFRLIVRDEPVSSVSFTST